MNTALTHKHFFGFNNLSITGTFLGPKVMLTPEGGYAVLITNKSGAVTVKGKLAVTSTSVDSAVQLAGANDTECFGIFYESDIARGAETWVIVAGFADVLLKNNTAGTHGNWVEASDEAGYGDATATSPPAAPDHFHEVGHCTESVSAAGEGTHVLCRCMIHFN